MTGRTSRAPAPHDRLADAQVILTLQLQQFDTSAPEWDDVRQSLHRDTDLECSRIWDTWTMSPTFRRGSTERPKSANPERLFDDLPRTRDGVPSLWAHQADMLREYSDLHVSTADVALELPTGAGKTLPALLIAEWRRASLGHRVVYACPNVQLTHQVHAAAARQGITAVALHGSHHLWETADAARYDSARAIAIATYSTIFNSRPALSVPQTVLFDDSHAGEQYVTAAWSVTVSRSSEPELYQRLLAAIGSELAGTHLQRLQSSDPDHFTRSDVRLLPIGALRRKASDVDLVLGSVVGDTKHRYTMIRAALERCLLFFGWDGILIRPYIAPTAQHAHFADAEQRIYISATLGDGGELERAFGRAPIARLPVPAGWDQRSSGRRFFVFPDLVRGVDSRSIASAVVEEAGKALVIAPSDRRLAESQATIVPSGMQVFGKNDIESSLEGFRTAARGVLALANRYDGIDLADEACRLNILDGLPGGEHLQERFLVRSLRASRVLEERLRTRVVQGAGRCTRGLKDHSVVIVLGDDLTRFLQRSEIRSALRTETQAEISFGVTNSEVTETELRVAIRSFLAQDDDWQNEAEPLIADLRREAVRLLPAGTDALAACAADEVKAWGQLWRGDYLAASQTAVAVASRLTAGVLSPYRALWLYLASAWQDAGAEEGGDSALRLAAKELLIKAHAAAKGTTWLREIAPLPPGDVVVDPLDDYAVGAVAAHSARRDSATKWAKRSTQMIEKLTGTDHIPFESALSTLGGLLGAEAYKPPGNGRADSVWVFGQLWWLTLEAKSEALATGLVSMDNVRQANTQLRSLAADRDSDIPELSASIIVSPRLLADPDAVAIAEPHVNLCSPGDVLGLAHDAVEAWRELRASATNLEGADAASIIRRLFADRRILPSAIRERIADRPVAS